MNRLIPCGLALMLLLAIVPAAMAQKSTKKYLDRIVNNHYFLKILGKMDY